MKINAFKRCAVCEGRMMPEQPLMYVGTLGVGIDFIHKECWPTLRYVIEKRWDIGEPVNASN